MERRDTQKFGFHQVLPLVRPGTVVNNRKAVSYEQAPPGQACFVPINIPHQGSGRALLLNCKSWSFLGLMH